MRVPLRGRKVRSTVSGADSFGEVAGQDQGSARDDSPLIEWIVDRPGLRLGLGDSVNYMGDADLVFSHLYGPLPPQLIGKPAIVNLFGNKKARGEEWCGAELHKVSKWATGLTNTIFVANLEPRALDLEDMIEDEFARGRGWFPLGLCERLLGEYAEPHMTVFDGFMGRGTVGKACIHAALELNFVGIDRDPARVVIAREYLGC